MNRINENRMSMLYAVVEVCLKFGAIWSGLIPFKNAHDQLKENVGKLETATRVQEAIVTGVATDKRKKRDSMVKKATEIAQGIYAYAVDQGNDILREQVDLAKTTFLRQRDAIIAQLCQNVHDTGVAEVANLGPYGLVAGDMTELQTLIDAYLAVVSSPRTAVLARKGATAEINVLMKESMSILSDRMDRLMPEFEGSAPDFHQEYFDARMVIDQSASAPDAPAKAA